MIYFIHEITIATVTVWYWYCMVVIMPVYHMGDEFYFMHEC